MYFQLCEKSGEANLQQNRGGEANLQQMGNGEANLQLQGELSNCAADKLRKYTRHSFLLHLRSLSFGQERSVETVFASSSHDTFLSDSWFLASKIVDRIRHTQHQEGHRLLRLFQVEPKRMSQ